jgi:hypothetical protein
MKCRRTEVCARRRLIIRGAIATAHQSKNFTFVPTPVFTTTQNSKCSPKLFGLSMPRRWSASTTMLAKNTMRPMKSPILKKMVAHKLPSFYADLIVARQRKILHPDVAETTSLKMFEPQYDEMYIPRSPVSGSAKREEGSANSITRLFSILFKLTSGNVFIEP